MDISIQKFRLSVAWTRLLKGPLNGIPFGKLPFLADKQQYNRKFLELINTPGDWELNTPWDQRKGNSKHHFWSYYLETTVPFPGNLADGDPGFWDRFVPFRKRINLKPTVEGPRLNLAGYFTAFSISLVVIIEWEGSYSVPELWKQVANAKRGRIYRIEEEDGALTLSQLAERGFQELLQYALGADQHESGPALPKDPVLVASVIKGSNIARVLTKDPLEKPEFNDLKYALYDFACWNEELFPHRANHPSIPNDDQALIKNKFQFDLGDIFYRQKRGRVIWLPRYFENTLEKWDKKMGIDERETFGDQKRKQKKIACFHNNTLLLTLQLEVLGQFIKELDLAFQDPKSRSALRPDIDEWARRAVKYTSNLYLGKDEAITGDIASAKVYRSLSAQYFLKDNKVLDSLNSLRNRYGWQSLP
ncbi:MAG TPA: hypothetical protein VHE34_09925 [Puia sp.]|uniref:hypothetical protein n=1 Tax=Puia sp. TaxID=2045100 RepID=UPI002C7FADCF|nr:hypothetical protein [Puia sp.]HVU95533.1 hypothetical protein [Puia sp.]